MGVVVVDDAEHSTPQVRRAVWVGIQPCYWSAVYLPSMVEFRNDRESDFSKPPLWTLRLHNGISSYFEITVLTNSLRVVGESVTGLRRCACWFCPENPFPESP